MADKAQTKAVGAALIELIWALRDGAGLDDVDEAQALGVAILAAIDDYKGDTDAAIAYTISGLAEAYGDKKADVVQ